MRGRDDGDDACDVRWWMMHALAIGRVSSYSAAKSPAATAAPSSPVGPICGERRERRERREESGERRAERGERRAESGERGAESGERGERREERGGGQRREKREETRQDETPPPRARWRRRIRAVEGGGRHDDVILFRPTLRTVLRRRRCAFRDRQGRRAERWWDGTSARVLRVVPRVCVCIVPRRSYTDNLVARASDQYQTAPSIVTRACQVLVLRVASISCRLDRVPRPERRARATHTRAGTKKNGEKKEAARRPPPRDPPRDGDTTVPRRCDLRDARVARTLRVVVQRR